MKSVLISIQPKWCELIANGKKTIEVRKTRPKIETPFKCYIYMTATKERCRFWEYITAYKNNKGDIVDGSQKVIGEFVCDWITEITPHCDIKDFVNQYIHGYPAILGENDCLSFQEMKAYLGNKKGYDWHISELKIYDKPKELGEFRKCDIYCGDCKHIVLPTDRLSLSDCDRRCDKFNKDLLFYDSFNRCEECLELNTITRPPQSWCYVEE